MTVTTATAPVLHLELSARGRSSPAGRDRVVDEVRDALAAGFPPSISLVVLDRDGVLLQAWGGTVVSLGEGSRGERASGEGFATTCGTLYDLASLTKVVATTTLALTLVDEGRWRLDDRVASWLSGFPRGDVTLFHLLTHTSGLVAHRPFYLLGHDRRAIRRAVYEQAAEGSAPGASVLYSDLNFMLLGWAATRCTRRPLDRLFHDVVATPLSMHRTRFRPPARQRPGTAATERDGDQRTGPGLIWGEVHDGNAHALGGVAGHAGLFAPAGDLGRFVAALLAPNHPVLTPGSIAAMHRHQAGSQPDVRGLGWRLEPPDWGGWPATTYWHTGFTGTSLLVAPEAGIGVVLLTNAVHPTRQLERQAAFRAAVHAAIADWLL